MSSVNPATPVHDALLRAEIDRSLRHPVMFFLTSGAAWLAVSILLVFDLVLTPDDLYAITQTSGL